MGFVPLRGFQDRPLRARLPREPGLRSRAGLTLYRGTWLPVRLSGRFAGRFLLRVPESTHCRPWPASLGFVTSKSV
jgi:hypothetical protein